MYMGTEKIPSSPLKLTSALKFQFSTTDLQKAITVALYLYLLYCTVASRTPRWTHRLIYSTWCHLSLSRWCNNRDPSYPCIDTVQIFFQRTTLCLETGWILHECPTFMKSVYPTKVHDGTKRTCTFRLRLGYFKFENTPVGYSRLL